jgi:hypothetical protein
MSLAVGYFSLICDEFLLSPPVSLRQKLLWRCFKLINYRGKLSAFERCRASMLRSSCPQRSGNLRYSSIFCSDASSVLQWSSKLSENVKFLCYLSKAGISEAHRSDQSTENFFVSQMTEILFLFWRSMWRIVIFTLLELIYYRHIYVKNYKPIWFPWLSETLHCPIWGGPAPGPPRARGGRGGGPGPPRWGARGRRTPPPRPPPPGPRGGGGAIGQCRVSDSQGNHIGL